MRVAGLAAGRQEELMVLEELRVDSALILGEAQD